MTGNRQPATGNRIQPVGPALRARPLLFEASKAQGAGPRARWSGRRGQTTTEYLMIAGIMTAIGIIVLLWMFEPWRETVEDVADCVRTDDCDAVGAQ